MLKGAMDAHEVKFHSKFTDIENQNMHSRLLNWKNGKKDFIISFAFSFASTFFIFFPEKGEQVIELQFEIIKFDKDVKLFELKTESYRKGSQEYLFRKWCFLPEEDLKNVIVDILEEDKKRIVVSSTKSYIPWWLFDEPALNENLLKSSKNLSLMNSENVDSIDNRESLTLCSTGSSSISSINSDSFLTQKHDFAEEASSVAPKTNKGDLNAMTAVVSSTVNSTIDLTNSMKVLRLLSVGGNSNTAPCTSFASLASTYLNRLFESNHDRSFLINNNNHDNVDNVENSSETVPSVEPALLLRTPETSLNDSVSSAASASHSSAILKSPTLDSIHQNDLDDSSSSSQLTNTTKSSVSRIMATSSMPPADNLNFDVSIDKLDSSGLVSSLTALRNYIDSILEHLEYIREMDSKQVLIQEKLKEAICSTLQEDLNLKTRGELNEHNRYVKLLKRLSVNSKQKCEDAISARKLYCDLVKEYNCSIQNKMSFTLCSDLKKTADIFFDKDYVNFSKIEKLKVYQDASDFRNTDLYREMMNYEI